MDQQQIIKKLKQYKKLVKGIVNPSSLYLYGSQLKGTATTNSDIDVAVIVDNFEGNVLETLTALYKLRREIDDRIEPILLDRNNDPSGFTADILINGKII
ncbi:MAG: nucleotidyltransferase domain-containing protein [Candidatus Margulisbacteria bacterium]|nr:nucleotidyltransferase domain-containing protein [Candidatus Margulisiibacteriota bacterium]